MEVTNKPFQWAQRLVTFKHSLQGTIIQIQNNVGAFFVSPDRFFFFVFDLKKTQNSLQWSFPSQWSFLQLIPNVLQDDLHILP